MKFKKFLATLTLIILVMPIIAHADALTDITNYLGPTASVYGQPPLTGQDTTGWLIARVGAVVQVFLSLLGLVMVLLVLYGGYLWMTARGNEQQVEEAKHTIQSAAFGALVIIAAGAITFFVIHQVGGKLLR